MHLGHARTFLTAQERARKSGGALVLRVEDLDRSRCKPEFVGALETDLSWAGLSWDEGPGREGPYGSCVQSERLAYFREVWRRLFESGAIYPCVCSRKDVLEAMRAPHEGGRELIYPGTCRGKTVTADEPERSMLKQNWRFRVPDGEAVAFCDGNKGETLFTAGRDFWDFLVWRKDGFPSYELAVVADDAAMEITEVVRGEDLLLSTARQILLYQALGWAVPAFFHCELVRDEEGRRLSKRDGAVSLKALRERGVKPETLGTLMPRTD